ncbi:MAG: glycosyltransferase family 2 protein [Dehalococcoidia bacterium]
MDEPNAPLRRALPVEPKVTVITATYNHERYIGRAIESVLNQTFPYWEQIIVSRGSTDDTETIVSSYSDPRIKLIREERRGLDQLARTYNLALARSRAPIVAVLDGDDFWPADKLERQLPSLEDPDVVLSYGWIRVIGPDGKVLGGRQPRALPAHKGIVANTPVGSVLRKLLFVNFVPWGSLIIRKGALEAAGGFAQPVPLPPIDYPTCLELSLQGRWVFIDAVVAYQQLHSASATAEFPLDHAQVGVAIATSFAERAIRNGYVDSREVSLEGVRRAAFRYVHGVLVRKGIGLLLAHQWKEASSTFAEVLRDSGAAPKYRVLAVAGRWASFGHVSPRLPIALLRAWGYELAYLV